MSEFWDDHLEFRAQLRANARWRVAYLLGKKEEVMPSRRVMEHTRMRFGDMSEQKLWTRMGKITNHEKLSAFTIVAEEEGMPDLAVAASARLARLQGRSVKPHTAGSTTTRNVETGRLERRLDL